MLSFWAYTSSNNGTFTSTLLDARAFPVHLGDKPEVKYQNGLVTPARHIPSAKIMVWANRDDALHFMRRAHKGHEIRDLGDRFEVDMPATDVLPALTIAMTKVTVQ